MEKRNKLDISFLEQMTLMGLQSTETGAISEMVTREQLATKRVTAKLEDARRNYSDPTKKGNFAAIVGKVKTLAEENEYLKQGTGFLRTPDAINRYWEIVTQQSDKAIQERADFNEVQQEKLA
ncbi:MAG: hypothetical protein FWE16_00730 [Firmicutes bacterium]|nr:hypothetical protein [Bacillota bacterium]